MRTAAADRVAKQATDKLALAKDKSGTQIFLACVEQDLEAVFNGTIWLGYFNRVNKKRAFTRLPELKGAALEEFRLANEAFIKKNPAAHKSHLVDTKTEKDALMTTPKATPKAPKPRKTEAEDNAPEPKRGRPIQNADSRITILVKENPKRPGTAGHARFSLYKNGMTVAEFVAVGGKTVDVAWDSKHNFIKLD